MGLHDASGQLRPDRQYEQGELPHRGASSPAAKPPAISSLELAPLFRTACPCGKEGLVQLGLVLGALALED
jgi:hypothetical protein